MIQKKKFSEAISANISVVEGLLPVATLTQKGLLPNKILSVTVSAPSASNNLVLVAKSPQGEALYISAILSAYYGGYNYLYSIVGSKNGFNVKRISSSTNNDIKFYTDNLGNLYVKPITELATSRFRLFLLDGTNMNVEESFVISDENVDNLQQISVDN